MSVDYRLDVLITGYPGKTAFHGGLGWSTVAMLSNENRRILIDVSSFGSRPLVLDELRKRGFEPEDVTDVLLTHSHWDHSVNWTLFPRANIVISRTELAWAKDEPPGGWHVPELYIRELANSPRLRVVDDGDEVAPGIVAHAVPGHTPGHLVYVAHGSERDIVFSGDAAKNRAELLSRSVAMSLDEASSIHALERIWQLWKARPGNVLVPGHDVMMALREGEPYYLADAKASIIVWAGESLAHEREIDLT
ncbi:MAG: hypothetical protein NVS2B17_29600 [Candidatus Velthaea sp.]